MQLICIGKMLLSTISLYQILCFCNKEIFPGSREKCIGTDFLKSLVVLMDIIWRKSLFRKKDNKIVYTYMLRYYQNLFEFFGLLSMQYAFMIHIIC